MPNPYKILTNLTAAADSYFSGSVEVSGNAKFSGSVNLGDTSSDIITATGQLTASNGLNVQNGAYIAGGLTVAGNLTYVSTTNLEVTDAKVVIAKNMTSLFNDGDSGLYVGSEGSPSASFYASQPTNGGSVYWNVSGSGGLKVASTSSDNFGNISATSLVNSSVYNLEEVLRAIDTKFGTVASTANFFNKTQVSGIFDVLTSSYDSLRQLKTGSLNENGNAVVTLDKFSKTLHDFVLVDVMVREAGTVTWTNDLVSVYVATGTTHIEVTIDAPAAAGWGYKIIAVNENTGTLTYKV